MLHSANTLIINSIYLCHQNPFHVGQSNAVFLQPIQNRNYMPIMTDDNAGKLHFHLQRYGKKNIRLETKRNQETGLVDQSPEKANINVSFFVQILMKKIDICISERSIIQLALGLKKQEKYIVSFSGTFFSSEQVQNTMQLLFTYFSTSKRYHFQQLRKISTIY